MEYSLLLKLSPIIIIIIYSIIVTIRSMIWGKDILSNQKSKQNLYNATWFIILAASITYMISIIIKYSTLPIEYLYIFFTIFLSVFKLYESNAEFKITNKGFIYHSIFYTWDRFTNYSWNNNLLTLITTKNKNVNINIPINEKCVVDSFISKYINTNIFSN